MCKKLQDHGCPPFLSGSSAPFEQVVWQQNAEKTFKKGFDKSNGSELQSFIDILIIE
jgi:hypothetical protein